MKAIHVPTSQVQGAKPVETLSNANVAGDTLTKFMMTVPLI